MFAASWLRSPSLRLPTPDSEPATGLTTRSRNSRGSLRHSVRPGEALVIEHPTNTTNTSDSNAVWRSFVTEMSKARMYPVWETATIVTGYTTFMPAFPPHVRRDFLRPKLCLRFSTTGDPHDTESRLQSILAENPTGCGYDD